MSFWQNWCFSKLVQIFCNLHCSFLCVLYYTLCILQSINLRTLFVLFCLYYSLVFLCVLLQFHCVWYSFLGAAHSIVDGKVCFWPFAWELSFWELLSSVTNEVMLVQGCHTRQHHKECHWDKKIWVLDGFLHVKNINPIVIRWIVEVALHELLIIVASHITYLCLLALFIYIHV